MTTSTDEKITENIAVLLQRTNLKVSDLQRRTGLARTTIDRKMDGMGWKASDLDRLAPVLRVTVAELVSQLPDPEEWRNRAIVP